MCVFFKEPDAAHVERFGIFVGLWAPTFFALSDRLNRYVVNQPSQCRHAEFGDLGGLGLPEDGVQ